MKNYMANGSHTRFYPFTTRVKCAICGSSYHRCLQKKAAGKVAYWRCIKGGQCESTGLREDFLEQLAAKAMGIETFDDDRFRQKVEWIAMGEKGRITFHFKDGLIQEIPYTSPRKEGTPHTEAYKKLMSQKKKEYWEKKHKEAEKECRK